MTLERDDEPTIDEVRQWETENPWDDDAIPSRLLRALLRRLEREAEAPSEAEARKEMRRVLDDGWTTPEQEDAAVSAYRAAVLREAEAETVVLVERLMARTAYACQCEACARDVRDADAWLAARRKGER